MKNSICIVTFPLGKSGRTPLLNLIKLFSELVNEVYVVSGGEVLEELEDVERVRFLKVTHKVSSNIFMRIFNYICTQLKILQHTVKILKNVDLFIFFIGGESLLIPILVLRLLGKRVLLMPAGIAAKVCFFKNDPFFKIISLLISINSILVNRLILYSHSLINEGNFARYRGKIIIAHRHFVDFDRFILKKKINERLNLVGYIGRLSKEKGVLNLIEAIPLILRERDDSYFVIIGHGNLTSKIRTMITAKHLDTYVKLTGWVSHKDIPLYLNELKLLILPSFTEGLPNIILEAMACGTPVLASPVGAIPDIIKEGETGFLLKSNEPKHIAKRTVELLKNPIILEKVSINAYNYVRENFSYEKVLEIWRNILSEFLR